MLFNGKVRTQVNGLNWSTNTGIPGRWNIKDQWK